MNKALRKTITAVLAVVIVMATVVTAAPAQAFSWGVGNLIGLCQGTLIREGPGNNYVAHTTVPEDNWTVKVIDGPRTADGQTWWDTSRRAAGDPSGGTGWVSQSQAEGACSDSGGGGGGDDGGGGGGGGGGTPPCAPVGLTLDLFYLRMPYQYGPFVKTAPELTASADLSRCPALVTVSGTGSSFSVQAPRGEISFDDKLDLESSSYQIGKTNYRITAGRSNAGGAAEEGLYGGMAHDASVSEPDVFSLATTNESRMVFVPNPPDFSYIYSISPQRAQIMAYVVVAFAIVALAVETLPAGVLAAFLLVIGSWFQQETGVPLGSPAAILQAAPEARLSIQTTETPIGQPDFDVSDDVIDLVHSVYGPMADYATIGSMSTDRATVSAYTVLHYEAAGFTPDGEVAVAFGLPGKQPLLAQAVRADNQGVVRGTLEMPIPDETPIGTYLLSAMDYPSLNAALSQMVSGQTLSPTFFMAGTIVEVVPDVTPPVTLTTLAGEAGNDGWFKSDVQVSLSATDDLSGVASTYYRVDSDPYTVGISFTVGEGRHTIYFYSVDKVGNTETVQSQAINVDKTPPTVQVYADKLTYTRVEPFVVHYSAADPYPGSGIAALSAALDGQAVHPDDTVDLFWKPLGTYAVTVKADDVAGWQTVNEAPFQIVANTESLLATVDRLCTLEEIKNAGLCNSLTQKLKASLRQQQAGNIVAAAKQLDAFMHEVNAQTGKGITERASSILLMDAQYSKAHLTG